MGYLSQKRINQKFFLKCTELSDRMFVLKFVSFFLKKYVLFPSVSLTLFQLSVGHVFTYLVQGISKCYKSLISVLNCLFFAY